MAQPKMALEQHPVGATTQITVNSDGTVTPESAFVLGQGSIQFVSNYAQQIAAKFVPTGVFGDSTGDVPIYPNNNQNPPIRAQQPYVTVNYSVNLGNGTIQGPYSVTVGCAPLALNFDANGNMLIPKARIPNGGIVEFLLSSQATGNLAVSFDPTGPFGSGLTLQPGIPQVLHADDVDTLVTVSVPSPRAGQGGTVKIGSGGGPQPGK
ncbi:MAG: hypothetical protein WCA98_16910 [Candidatus Acidiferrales bacterium]